MIRLVRLVGVEPFMTVSAGSAQNQSEKGNTLWSNRVFHSMPLDCDDTIRKSGNLTLIRHFSGTLNRIYANEQRRFDVGFPGYLRSQDVNGKNIPLDDCYAPFRKFSSRRTFELRLMPASTITSRCGRNRWYSVF